MQTSQLSEFLDGAGSKPYRELIQYHLSRQSTQQLQQGALGESLTLPDDIQPFVMTYIDHVNARLAYDKSFWETATCRDAFDVILDIAVDVLPLEGILESKEDALRFECHDLAFSLFQVPTLSIAYSASTQRKQRQFMGIRKGLFG